MDSMQHGTPPIARHTLPGLTSSGLPVAMAPTVREADCSAAPATVWAACFADMQWERWDPDVRAVKDVAGGCTSGATFTFVMKEGPMKEVACTLSDVVEAESLTFSGSAMAGLLSFSGTITLRPTDSGGSHVKYEFGLGGPIGMVAGIFNSAPVVEGTENGLANIVRIAEEA